MGDGSQNVHASGMERRIIDLDGTKVGVMTYQLGADFRCKVDNVDPGSVIGRGTGPTKETAEAEALEDARVSLRLRNSLNQLKRVNESLKTLLPDKKKGGT